MNDFNVTLVYLLYSLPLPHVYYIYIYIYIINYIKNMYIILDVFYLKRYPYHSRDRDVFLEMNFVSRNTLCLWGYTIIKLFLSQNIHIYDVL
jgi:hypothetical protein